MRGLGPLGGQLGVEREAAAAGLSGFYTRSRGAAYESDLQTWPANLACEPG